MELDVCHFSLLVKQYERVIQDLRAQLNEEKESVKRREKGRVRKVWLWWALIGKRREKEIHVMGGTDREREKGRIRNVWLWWALIGKGKRREKNICNVWALRERD